MEINFAAWNINRAAGTANPGSQTQVQKKYSEEIRVERLLEKRPDLDFVFLQEVPGPDRLRHLFRSVDWCPIPNPEKRNSGILFCQTGHNAELGFKPVPFPETVQSGIVQDPVGAVYSIFRKDKPDEEILRFIGFWNVPKKSAERSDTKALPGAGKYLPHLLNFLDRSMAGLDDHTLSHYIFAGDTNVNIRTEEEAPGIWTETGVFLEEYLKNMKKGLKLIHDGADDYTLRLQSTGKWFRCDLLIASGHIEFSSVSLGEEKDYMWKGKTAGSDHKPLFFSIPC